MIRNILLNERLLNILVFILSQNVLEIESQTRLTPEHQRENLILAAGLRLGLPLSAAAVYQLRDSVAAENLWLLKGVRKAGGRG